MTEDIRARAIRGDVRTIAGLLWALSAPTAPRSQWHIAAAGLTPGGLWALLDTAETHRPRTDHDQEREFADALGTIAGTLVPLAVLTREPWNQVLSHPVFRAPLITRPKQIQGPGFPQGAPLPHPGGPVLDALAFAVTAGLVPFLQTIATQAGQRTFDAARATLRERVRRGGGRVAGPQLVFEEHAGRTQFHVPSDIPDAALEALAAIDNGDLEALAAPDPRGRVVTVHWNAESGQWERTVQRH